MVCYNNGMKVLLFISLFVLSLECYGLSCTASRTNNDPTVITKCYARMLSHFEEVLKRQLAYTYASHLKHTPDVLEHVDGLVASYVPAFTVLEQVKRLLHKLHYPDPRPAVRCETPQNGG